jgi:AcrR family transcriptional regulator
MTEAAAAPAPERLPSGRHGLARAFVIANQRDRVLDAMASEVAEKGYVAVTVAGVRKRAGVSSKTFYELFEDKADCVLAAYDAAVETLMGHIAAVFAEMPEPTPAQGRAALGAILDACAAEPDFARMCFVEVSAAGPQAVKRYLALVDSLVRLVEQIDRYAESKRHRAVVNPDAVMHQALVGGIASVVHKHLVDDRTHELPDVLPQLTYFLLAPFIGEEEAAATAFGQ